MKQMCFDLGYFSLKSRDGRKLIGSFVEHCRTLHVTHMHKRFNGAAVLSEFGWQARNRYVRVYRDDKQERVTVCFIDNVTGDVLRPKTWNTPDTSMAHGNIFDSNKGLGQMGPMGLSRLGDLFGGVEP